MQITAMLLILRIEVVLRQTWRSNTRRKLSVLVPVFFTQLCMTTAAPTCPMGSQRRALKYDPGVRRIIPAYAEALVEMKFTNTRALEGIFRAYARL